MPMGDVLFTIRADASQAQKEVLDTAKTVGVLQNATAEQKREFARLENETTDVTQAMRRLRIEDTQATAPSKHCLLYTSPSPRDS